MGNGALPIGPKRPRPSSTLPTLPALAVQQDGSYLGCTGNRLTYAPAGRRIGSDNVSSRILSSPAWGGRVVVIARLDRAIQYPLGSSRAPSVALLAHESAPPQQARNRRFADAYRFCDLRRRLAALESGSEPFHLVGRPPPPRSSGAAPWWLAAGHARLH